MKIKAGTLIETLIALVVVMVVFSISIMIYQNVTGGCSSARQLTADLILSDEMINTIKGGSFIDEDIQVKDLTIVKSVEKYDRIEDLLMITLKCIDKDGKELLTKQQLFFNR
ncbi:MAG: hypothetical protein HRT71_17220 [Flavobacteriales bacterium]|nr:hypothetical protein [Flavobacteriales bacterium]